MAGQGKESDMTAFNIVRFRVRPGQVENFIELHRKFRHPFKGFGGGWLVRTGEQTFCFVGQWKTFESIVNARPEMIGLLDEMRGMLEDLGGGLGVTDPVSGEAILKVGATKPAKRRVAAARKAKPATKRPSPARKRKPAPKKR
jgi:hypothetical protein